MGVVPELMGRVGHIIDLGSDFRLHDAALYPQWYGADHTCPELLPEAVYGLPELFRSKLAGAKLIAATGCNAATAILSLAPFLDAGVIEAQGLIVDLITGVSGAGRPPKEHTTFCTVDSDVTAYGLLTHRHTPEIEQALADGTGHEASVLFTPHLVPMNRGILATCYGRPTESGADLSSDDAPRRDGRLLPGRALHPGSPTRVPRPRPPWGRMASTSAPGSTPGRGWSWPWGRSTT